MIYLLRALQYPEADAFACDDEHRFRKLVLWVENRKIREYKPEDRFRLSQLDSDDWNSAFREYAEDLRCPIRFSAQARPRVLEWMIRFAISLEYGDNAEELNAFAAGLLGDRDGRGSEAVAAHASKPEVAHEMPADIKQRLARLMQLLNMDAGERSYREQASEALRKLRQVLPAAKLSRAEMQEQLDAVPLGFTTKDKQVDEAARVLRLLYIQDLLKLQTQIDQAIATVQEYTANPRTDPSLGRVGT